MLDAKKGELLENGAFEKLRGTFTWHEHKLLCGLENTRPNLPRLRNCIPTAKRRAAVVMGFRKTGGCFRACVVAKIDASGERKLLYMVP